MGPPPDVFVLRVLPASPAALQLLRSHLEAHDHLAVATDLPDGSVEIQGPLARADEIRAVTGEIARALGLLTVATPPRRD